MSSTNPTQTQKSARQTNWIGGIAVVLIGAAVCGFVVWGGNSLNMSDQSAKNSAPPRPRPAEPEVAPDEKLLAEDMRQFLWDVEHIAFEMEQKVLPKINQALTEPNRELLETFLSDEFTAQVPQEEWNEVVATSSLRIVRQEMLPSEPVDATKEDFVKRMLAYRDNFDSESEIGCKSKIGLVRLGPVDKSSMDGPWSGLWRIRLWGEEEGFPAEIVMDLDVDLEPLQKKVAKQTKFVRMARLKHAELRTCQQQLLKDVTAESGIDVASMYDYWKVPVNQFVGSSGGIYLSDYDHDGNLDLLIDDHYAGVVLYRGLGNLKFEVANEKANIPNDAGRNSGACWADLDNDGDDDLICGSRLFSNDGDGTFTEVSSKSNLRASSYTALSIADYDGDGLVDIYESHAHDPSSKQLREKGAELSSKSPSWIDGGWGFHNVLWRNLGNWKFEDVTDQANASDLGGTSFSSVWFDANNDNWPDILAINEFGRNSLLINQKNGTFRRTTIDPIFGGWSMGVIAGDYDNDGDSDVFVANMYSKAGNRVISNVDKTRYPNDIYEKIYNGTLGNKLYQSNADGTFGVVPYDPVFASIGWTYGNVFVDYNGDGHLDLYATAGFKSEKKGKPDG